MEKMSRVKKYEDLYESVNGENEELNEIESAVNSLRNPSDNNYDYNKMDEHFDDKGTILEDTGEFKNEYLDSFIQEIKEYNMKKGVIESEDTNLDILKQLSAKQRLKRSGYQIDDELNEVDKKAAKEINHQEVFSNNKQQPAQSASNTNNNRVDEDIADQVKQLLNEEDSSLFGIKKDQDVSANYVASDDKSTDERLNELTTQINLLAKEDEKLNADLNESEDVDDLTKQKLMEETQKIQIQLDATKDEMNNIQQKVEDNNKKTTKLLTLIIAILIVLLACGLAAVFLA